MGVCFRSLVVGLESFGVGMILYQGHFRGDLGNCVVLGLTVFTLLRSCFIIGGGRSLKVDVGIHLIVSVDLHL